MTAPPPPPWTEQQIRHTREHHGVAELNTLIAGGRKATVADLCDSHESLRAEIARLTAAVDTVLKSLEGYDAVNDKCNARAEAAEAKAIAAQQEIARLTAAVAAVDEWIKKWETPPPYMDGTQIDPWVYAAQELRDVLERATGEGKQTNPCPKCGTFLWGDMRPCWNCAREAMLAERVTGEETRK